MLALALNFASFNMGDEKGQKEHYGYDYVASIMAIRNSPLAIFRRFGKLEMLNLLSLQAELMELEERFDSTIRENTSGKHGVDVENFDYSFKNLKDAHKEYDDHLGGGGGEATREKIRELIKGHKQYDLLLDIRKKLKEYGLSPSPSSQLVTN